MAQEELPVSVKGFDSAPDDARVGVGVFGALMGVLPGVIFHMAGSGELAQGQRQGGVTTWSVAQVRQAIGLPSRAPAAEPAPAPPVAAQAPAETAAAPRTSAARQKSYRERKKQHQADVAVAVAVTSTGPAVIGGEPSTMTSLEIAELVESRHDDVKRSIQRLAERGVTTLPPLAEVSNPGAGPKTISVYRVGKRDSFVIVAQLSPEFTARLVDRWQELEQRVAQPSPAQMLNDPASLRQALLGYVEKSLELERELAVVKPQVAALEAEVTTLAPKAAALNRIAASEGSMTLTAAAKDLKLQPRAGLIPWLRENEWIFRRNPNREWEPFQDRIDARLMECRPFPYEDSRGVECMRNQAMVTPKGLARLAELFAAEREA